MALIDDDDVIDLTEDDGIVWVPPSQASKTSGGARAKIASPQRKRDRPASSAVAVLSVSPSSGSSSSSWIGSATGGAGAAAAASSTGAASSSSSAPATTFARLEWEMTRPAVTESAKQKAKQELLHEALALKECSVCIEAYDMRDPTMGPHSLRCGHLFHKHCIEEMHKAGLAAAVKAKRPPQDALCPICKTPFTPDTAHRIFL